MQNDAKELRRWIEDRNDPTAGVKAAKIAAAAGALGQRLHHQRNFLAAAAVIPAGPVGTLNFDHKLR